MSTDSREVHVFPVPEGMDTIDAFMEIRVLGRLHGYRPWKRRFRKCTWYTVTVVYDERGEHLIWATGRP